MNQYPGYAELIKKILEREIAKDEVIWITGKDVDKMKDILKTLKPEQQQIITELYGLGCQPKKSINDLAEQLGVNLNQISVIQILAIWNLRNSPSISVFRNCVRSLMEKK